MIHPEKPGSGSEVLKELVYQNLLLPSARGSDKLRRYQQKLWLNCIQNDPLDSENILRQAKILEQRQRGRFEGGKMVF